MDLDKIIEALLICSKAEGCDGCPYEGKKDCGLTMLRNAAAAIKELRAKAEPQKARAAAEGVVDEATMETITELRDEVAAQAQAIETLQAINAKLEGKVEAYEHVLRLLTE